MIDLDMFLILKQAETQKELFEGKYEEEIKEEEEAKEEIKEEEEAKEESVEEKYFPFKLKDKYDDKGYFRFVYVYPDYVIKTARTDGPQEIYQDALLINKRDADLSMQSKYPQFTCKTFRHAPDYSWIMQERAEKVGREEIREMLIPEYKGIGLREYLYYVVDKINEQGEYEGPGTLPKITTDFAAMIKEYGIDIKELSLGNMGKVKRNGKWFPVIIDTSRHKGTFFTGER